MRGNGCVREGEGRTLDVGPHSGDCDFRHGVDSLPEELGKFLW